MSAIATPDGLLALEHEVQTLRREVDELKILLSAGITHPFGRPDYPEEPVERWRRERLIETEQYAGKHVAVDERAQLVDADESFNALHARIKERGMLEKVQFGIVPAPFA